MNKAELIKRLKSLAWRAGAMLLALGVDFALENLSLFSLSTELTVVIGLILGEISKAIHNRYLTK